MFRVMKHRSIITEILLSYAVEGHGFVVATFALEHFRVFND
jgi:hypothetical protein